MSGALIIRMLLFRYYVRVPFFWQLPNPLRIGTGLQSGFRVQGLGIVAIGKSKSCKFGVGFHLVPCISKQ